MFNPHSYQNSHAGGTAFLEIVQHPERNDDHGSAQPPQPRFMPLKRTDLDGTISGPVARLRVKHVFGHPEETDGPVLEAVYRFPLPGDAAVTGVVVRFGDTEIRAELSDRHDAEKEYDRARQTGHQAVLLSRESPDVFSLHVSGIEAGQDVEITTDFVQSLRPARDGFTFRFPLTVTPRYVSEEGFGGRYERGQPLALVQDPGHRFSMQLSAIGAEEISSNTHQITARTTGDGLSVDLADGEIIPDRDFVLNVSFATRTDRPSLTAYHHPDRESGHDYLLALVQPPSEVESSEIKPREIILLVDRSGSMSGPKWEAADWAVHRFLDGLRPEDHFSVGLFHSTTVWFSRVSVPATPENVRYAQEFVDAHDDSGGTYLELALEEAISCGRASGELARHIVIITDAQVTNAQSNLAFARAESERSTRRRISMLCIDAAPNSWLVHELVAVGGGQASFLTSDPDEGDITTALDEIMAFWDRPIATGMTLSVNRKDVWVMGRPVKDEDSGSDVIGRIDLGDLPAGQPIWVVARSTHAEDPLRLELAADNNLIIEDELRTLEADDAIKKLFGARRLAALELQTESPGRRRRRRPRQSEANLREQLVSESLHYGLVCSETSFIAVREEAGKLVQRGAIIPNALAHGWSDGFVAYSLQRDMPASPIPESRAFEAFADAEYSVESSSMDSRASYYQADRPRYSMEDRGGTITLFQGKPDLSKPDVTLFETDRFEHGGRLTALHVTLEDDDEVFDGELLLYVGDRPEPRARMRLRDVLRLRGRRPLHIRVRSSQSITLVLRDITSGATVPELEIRLDWE